MYEWAELRHFRYLLAILEKQGFRAAAEQLHTSQPNLTVQARQFQELASIRLFRRMRSGRIRPTATGIAFVAMARLLLETRDEIIEALRAVERGEISALRFGCSPLADQSLFRSLCRIHKEIMPTCSIRPTHGDPAHLCEEIASGAVAAAVVTLPLEHPELLIEEVRRDRLVACLRRDHVLANKAAVNAADLRGNLSILYHPKRHPEGHERLIKLLSEAGITLQDPSHASHPSEMLTLVKEGHGLTLIREGTPLDEELTTRPVVGVDWTVDTAVIYHKERYPKTVPILVKRLKQQLSMTTPETSTITRSVETPTPLRRIPSRATPEDPEQLSLLG